MAMPEGGFESFNRYLAANLQYPEEEALTLNAIVLLSFSIDLEGQPANIEVNNSPAEAYSLEAVRLLQGGPAWAPVIREGILVEDRIQIRIEFKKE
jgi:hypothetical protein